MATSAHDCARAVLESVPHLMRVIRQQVRARSSPDLTIPQFRALAFLGRNKDAMLADVAAFLGLTPPAASKLIDTLVSEKLVSREAGEVDRRRISLTLTSAGHRKYTRMLEATEDFLAGRLQDLGVDARVELVRSLEALHTLFEDPPEVRRATAKRKLKS